MKPLLWFCQILSVSAQGFSVLAERSPSVMDVVTSKLMLLWSLRILAVNAIREPRTSIPVVLLGLVAVFVVRYVRSPWRKLPPGPRGLPIIGNVLQLMDVRWLLSMDCKDRFGVYTIIDHLLPSVLSWIHETTGEVMYINAAGQPTVVLNSLKSSFELLERRAINYSDRPRYIMVQEIISQNLLFATMPFGDR